MTTTIRPKVLRLGKIEFAQDKWAEISQFAEVIDCESQTRKEFINDLQTKYNDITNIARTYASVEQTGRFDAELAQYMPKSLVSLSHNGAGYDQIDVQPFTDRGIQVSNVTVPVEGPTAVTAVYLVLSCLRNYQEGHQILVNGGWDEKKCGGAKLGHSPEGKVVGILGMGGIGRAIRDRLEPFGFSKILYHNRKPLAKDLEGNAQYATKEELFKQADIICISVPLNEHTRHSVNKEAIGQMKDGVIIVNTARGAVIDEQVLPELIKSGKIGAFGADVFEHEPKISPELYELPQVVSLPHMGTHTYEAIKNMEVWVAENVESCIKTGKVKTIVPEQYNLEIKQGPLI
ncbi:GOR1 Glyoxylate reductase 1 [Candida maltosa Xu316]|uniref:2-hydroxyacid dehydrogenase, putative n=1 Tax=Candida maltosa (strain Xu316) TaxID=1245528 RepID=M3IIQ0_CANMX|nr:2-hydroxyacid dehydrogenase, putative [Candida maltosa Xu316]